MNHPIQEPETERVWSIMESRGHILILRSLSGPKYLSCIKCGTQQIIEDVKESEIKRCPYQRNTLTE